MLNPEDRSAIEGLFERLDAVEHKAPPRDPEAEKLIRQKIAEQPAAPYYMAQTILVQEHALQLAQQRIEELERRPQGGLFGGLFGDAPRQQPRYNDRAPTRQQRDGGPWERGNTSGGGFLAGAAQTALGVTTGVLLGSAIAGMLGAGAASASDNDQGNDTDNGSADTGGDDAGGGDFDGGGDFGGGDF